MRLRTHAIGPMIIIVICGASLGCKRNDMNGSIAPTIEDLEQAYEAPDPNLAGHQTARDVVVGSSGITVLCSANPKGGREHTWLIRLDNDGTVRWQHHYPESHGSGRALAALLDGGFVIAGELERSAMKYQGYLLHVGPDGGPVAGASFGADAGFNTIAVLEDGSILAGGTSRWKGWLLRADGALHSSSESPLADVFAVSALAPLSGGGFAVAARRELVTTGLDYSKFEAFTNNEQVRWQKQLPTTGRGEPAALAALPDGGLVAVGRHTAAERGDPQTWVVRLSESGDVLWEKLLGSADEVRLGTAVVALPDGGFAVAGAAQRDGHRGLRLARLTSDGTMMWERAYGGEQRDEATGLARTADGGFVLVGSTMSKGAGKTNVWILKLDSEGRLVWDRVFGTAG